MLPRVSVLMPIYKTNHIHLKEAINSILSQSYKDFEFLILSDSPEDTSLDEIVNSYDDNRIKYIKNSKTLGISLSRNKLINLAKGQYLATMDHDDVSLPNRFEKQVDVLDNNPSIGVVGSWYKRFPNEKLKKKKETNAEIEFDLTRSCAILHPASMIRKSVLINNNIFYDEQASPVEDYNLWVDLVGTCNFYNVQEVLFLYRDHGNNTSKIYNKKMRLLRNSILQKYKTKHPKYFSYLEKLKFLCRKKFGIMERKEKKAIKLYKKYYKQNVFPAISPQPAIKHIFNDNIHFENGRGAVFASYSKEPQISEYVLYYLAQLKKHFDFIVFVADNATSPKNLERLSGLVDIAHFENHGMYDFGSYKIGYNLAKDNGWLDNINDLLFCNDSIIGPIDDFSPLFKAFENKDFYGLSGNIFGYMQDKNMVHKIGFQHIQSYFFGLSKNVFKNDGFINFIQSIKPEKNKIEVIINYEMGLSNVIRSLGYQLFSYFPMQEDITDAGWKKFLHEGFFIKKKKLKRLKNQELSELNQIFMKHNYPFYCQKKPLSKTENQVTSKL